MLKVRCSSLGLLMSEPKSIEPSLLIGDIARLYRSRPTKDEDKTAKDIAMAPLWDRSLSAGAKSYVLNLAKQFVYEYKDRVSSKAMEKGIIVEPLSIELYNTVNFTSHTKNTERKENAWLTGECDIAANKIIDIKSSWSLATFPATRATAADSLYEWQVRGYMMLWDLPNSEVAHCLVNTPEELIGYEDESVHIVSNIDPGLRVTSVNYQRCPIKEALIKTKVEAAQSYFEICIEQINEDHS